MTDIVERLKFIAIDNAETLTEDEHATLSEAAAILSEAEKRAREARAKALEEAAKVACSVSDENRTGWKDTLSAHTVAKAIEDRIRALQSEGGHVTNQ